MSRDNEKMKRELLEILNLKRDVMSGDIAALQMQKREIEDALMLRQRVASEWEIIGGLAQAEAANATLSEIKDNARALQRRLETAQYERLSLDISIQNMSRRK